MRDQSFQYFFQNRLGIPNIYIFRPMRPPHFPNDILMRPHHRTFLDMKLYASASLFSAHASQICSLSEAASKSEYNSLRELASDTEISISRARASLYERYPFVPPASENEFIPSRASASHMANLVFLSQSIRVIPASKRRKRQIQHV